MELSSSPSGSLNKTDFYKSVRGGAVVFIGYVLVATITAFQSDLSAGTIDLGFLPSLPGFDLKTMASGLLLSGASTLVELVRRFVTDYSK